MASSAIGGELAGPFREAELVPAAGPVLTNPNSTSVLATLIPSGTKLDQCPAPKSGNKCCYDTVLNSCDCNHASCSATATEVAACTLARVTACTGSDMAVDACK